MKSPRLGVNIDHAATLKRLRDTPYPDLLIVANECIDGGADQITVHLREDRRHIVDEDVKRLVSVLRVDLNLEMAATQSMLDFALQTKPSSICIVPEKREERTTEGGLSFLSTERNKFLEIISTKAKQAGILVSFFIEPKNEDIKISHSLGAQAVELHTGALCIKHQSGDLTGFKNDLVQLQAASEYAHSLGLRVHAGHGIDYKIASEIAKIKDNKIVEYNIGHAIICESIFCGLKSATKKMKEALQV